MFLKVPLIIPKSFKNIVQSRKDKAAVVVDHWTTKSESLGSILGLNRASSSVSLRNYGDPRLLGASAGRYGSGGQYPLGPHRDCYGLASL